MSRPSGTKNIMRTAEEKETIVLEYLNNNIGQRIIAEKNNVSWRLLHNWIIKYQEFGIEGLKSKTGKHSNLNSGQYNRNPSEIEKLQRELLKKEIEISRLKKGYQVKGVGVKKEYVTTFEENTK